MPKRTSPLVRIRGSSMQDAEKAAKKLTDEAYCRGSNDNISCIVVRFNF